MSTLLGSSTQLGTCQQFAIPPTDINVNWLALSGQDVARSTYPKLSPSYPIGSMSAVANTTLSNVPTGNYGATNGTILVIPGAAGTSAIQTSADGGATWTSRTTPSVTVISIVWTGFRFIAATTSGAPIYSATGTTWSATTGGPSTLGLGQQPLAYSSSLGMTVCVGFNAGTTNIYTLLDGATAWVTRTCPLFNALGICWTGSKFIASPNSGGGAGRASLLSSANGITWVVTLIGTYVGSGVTSGLPIISNGSGTVVMPNSSATIPSVYVSTNHGVNWQVVRLPNSIGAGFSGSAAVKSGNYINGKFFISALDYESNESFIMSTDGFNWTADPVGTTRGAGTIEIDGVLFVGTTYFAWNSSGSNLVATESSTTFYLPADTNPTFSTGSSYQTYIRAT
jgi:hypothetical protein